jgi:hypothetical protein
MSEKQKDVLAPINGMATLAEALKDLPEDHAMFSREKLPNPVTDDFGTHTEKRKLEQGRAKILEEIQAGRVLMFSLNTPDGAKKVVGIGQTPDHHDPSRGGKKMLGAGRDNHDVGDYWMLVHKADDSEPPKPFYLSAEQIADLSLAPGDNDVLLHPFMENETEGRVIKIAGVVENVVTLE